ncbi:hypothetical protein T09_14254, partial [Trichinella sp. T9]
LIKGKILSDRTLKWEKRFWRNCYARKSPLIHEVSVLIFCFDQMMLILCVRTNGNDRFRSIPINKVSH